jgi:hypothetical protein
MTTRRSCRHGGDFCVPVATCDLADVLVGVVSFGAGRSGQLYRRNFRLNSRRRMVLFDTPPKRKRACWRSCSRRPRAARACWRWRSRRCLSDSDIADWRAGRVGQGMAESIAWREVRRLGAVAMGPSPVAIRWAAAGLATRPGCGPVRGVDAPTSLLAVPVAAVQGARHIWSGGP